MKRKLVAGLTLFAGLCMASCKDNNSGAESENTNIESRPGYEEGELENEGGGNPSTGGDSTSTSFEDPNLESGSDTRTGSGAGAESGVSNSGGSPHSNN